MIVDVALLYVIARQKVTWHNGMRHGNAVEFYSTLIRFRNEIWLLTMQMRCVLYSQAVMISACQLFLVAHVACCVAIVLAISAFALPDLDSFVDRWGEQVRAECAVWPKKYSMWSFHVIQNSPREGVLACVFGLYAFSFAFSALHVYLLMLLNGAKSAMEADAQRDGGNKIVSTLQVETESILHAL